MEDVPEPRAFAPPGLPEGVYNIGEGDAYPVLTRAAVVGGTKKAGDGAGDDAGAPLARLVFALHTVDLRDGWPCPVVADSDEDFEATACNEYALQTLQEERDLAQQRREELAIELHAKDASVPDTVDPPTTTVYMTGQLPNGRKVGLVASYRPSCQVEVPEGRDELWFTTNVLGRVASIMKLRRELLRVKYHYSTHFMGYRPDPKNPCQRRKCLFAQLSFPNGDLMKHGARILGRGLRVGWGPGAPPEPVVFAVHEDGIDLEQKFIDQCSLQPGGWHAVTAPTRRLARAGREMLVDEEYLVDAANIRAVLVAEEGGVDPSTVPSLSIASLDCEMNPHVANRFPMAHRRTDAVVIIGVVFAFAGAQPAGLREYTEYERRAYVLGTHCEPIPGVVVLLYQDELEMIAALRDELFVHKKVDVLLGHNSTKFDIKYLATRIAGNRGGGGSCAGFAVGPPLRFMRFGALPMEVVPLKCKPLNSAGMGANELWLLNGVGFAYVDTLLLAKQYHKMRENSLKYIADHCLSEPDPEHPGRFVALSKYDMPYALIPDAARGSALDVKKLAAYCIQDCVLPLRLTQVWDSVKDLVAQSRIITITMPTNVKVGQQQRVRNTLMNKAHRRGMVMNGVNAYRPKTDLVPSAEGGFVMTNVAGLHVKPVCVLDFASLYPSVQREYNLCWSTVDLGHITPADIARGLRVREFVTATGTFRFVQNVPGIFPEQLSDLFATRRMYKREMARHEKGSAEYQNADSAQKATKIVMNSGYGTANAQKGIMPCLAVGTVTCFMGRQLNQQAERFCRENFDAETLYGDTDSIMVYFREPPEVLAGTRKQRLEWAMKRGEEAEAAINRMFNSEFVKTEFEKVYYPFLSVKKKTYSGIKYEPGDLSKFTDNLDRPDKTRGIAGGAIESKGIRNVRRDVPLFCTTMANELLDVMLFDQDMEKFWDIVHTYTERVCHMDGLDLEQFTLTKEIKEAYASQAVVQPQVAISYAREYKVRGSAYVEGDRVAYVVVQEADPQRVVRPPWMGDGKSTGRDGGGGGHAADDDGEDGGGGDGDEWCCDAYKGAGGGPAKETSGMFARSVEEVVADPLNNHLDIVYYVEKGICSILKQLMPSEEGAQRTLIQYATAAADAYNAARNKFKKSPLDAFLKRQVVTAGALGVKREDIEPRLPKLSHSKPRSSGTAKYNTLAGLTRVVGSSATGSAAGAGAGSSSGSDAAAAAKPSKPPAPPVKKRSAAEKEAEASRKQLRLNFGGSSVATSAKTTQKK